ncbi:MAG: rhomboid family intramembrane serine protease [Sterolibacterium sp.]|jgi:membrane associated rhomboid family serine protease|nr:rhomboid family intramembrane serine protease [Sterolibacterium sp.]
MFARLPPVTRTLILCSVAIFFAQMLFEPVMVAWLALWPLAMPGFEGYPVFAPWQLVTYAFLHAGFTHLLFNMFGLYMFGGEIEGVFGSRRFLRLYFAAIVTGGVTQLMVLHITGGMPVPTVGASAGVFGVLLAFGLFFPRRMVVLLIPPIPMPAWLFVTLYGLLELGLGVFGSASGVAHFAHLGGMLGAWLVLRRWRR